MSPKQKAGAVRAAVDAFNNNRYGNGTHKWQDAEVAACNYLQGLGFTSEEAYEAGREIAQAVVSEIEDKLAEEYEKENG